MIVQCALLKCYTILGYSIQFCFIFPFLQTYITVQMRPSEVKGINIYTHQLSRLLEDDVEF